jgi:hypothetical protein
MLKFCCPVALLGLLCTCSETDDGHPVKNHRTPLELVSRGDPTVCANQEVEMAALRGLLEAGGFDPGLLSEFSDAELLPWIIGVTATKVDRDSHEVACVGFVGFGEPENTNHEFSFTIRPVLGADGGTSVTVRSDDRFLPGALAAELLRRSMQKAPN